MEIPVSSVLLVLLVSVVSFRVSTSEHTFKTVELHEAATLQCFKRCSGLVKWTVFFKPKDVLAQCDQTSCQSQEGYQMSHDEYLKGNLSLTITDADYSKRAWYTCQCDGEHICDVTLQLKPFSKPVHVQAGEPLSLDLSIFDDVEVTFNRSDDAGTKTLSVCKLEGRKAECESSYEKRVWVSFLLQVKDVKKHDGGVYIIRDTKNDEVIGTYLVTVNETNSEKSDESPAGGSPAGLDGSVAVPLAWLFGWLLVVTIVVNVLQSVRNKMLSVENQQLQKRLRQMENTRVNMQDVQQRVDQHKETENKPEIREHSPVLDTGDVQMTDVQKKLNDDSEDEDGQLDTDSLIHPPSVTDEPPLSHPVAESSPENSSSSCVPVNLSDVYK